MSDRRRPADLALEHARELAASAAREIREARHGLGLDQRAAARRAGLSASAFGRVERGLLQSPTLEQLCRAGRAVGLRPALTWHPADDGPRDRPQLSAFDRFVPLLAPPLVLRREVTLPIRGDRRAWDGRIEAPGGRERASVEVESPSSSETTRWPGS
jgi:transcriptional regulator with XRE-family HTH domain